MIIIQKDLEVYINKADMKQSESFKNKARTTDRTLPDGNTKAVVISLPLKYLHIFWKATNQL